MIFDLGSFDLGYCAHPSSQPQRKGRFEEKSQNARLRWQGVCPLLVLGNIFCAILTGPLAHARGTPEGFADLAERLLPAVVNISSTQVLPDQGLEMPQLPPGSPFGDFFEEFFDKYQGRGRQSPLPQKSPVPQRATSLGSGFIIDPEGYVVTNNHVIQDAEDITVILSDDTVLKADVVGRDRKVDLALLKVSTNRKLPHVSFGDSDTSRVGDWVVAIGNPFGLGGTVTSGIISAKTRDINAGPYDSFIQTDASINRGNSGGPLFNTDGEVIGVNTAIFSPSGGSVGIGFATPSNLVQQVLADLRTFGKTRRGWLGVRIQSVTDDIAESLGLERTYGALVASVQPDSPAAQAGLQAGDVVLQFNGREIKEMRRLPMIVAETTIGIGVPLEVWRDGRRKTVTVIVGELSEEEEVTAITDTPRSDHDMTRIDTLGLSVSPLDDGLRDQYDVPDDAKGALVTDVDAQGVATEKGLRPGDIVVEVNQVPVSSAANIRRQIKKARDGGRKSVLLLIQNAMGMRFAAIPLAGP